MTDAFLGVDVGTEAVRALAVTEDGTVVGSGSAPLHTAFPRNGWAEQDPAAIWTAFATAVSAATQQRRVRALALASTSASVCAIGEADEPLGSVILWMDTRSRDEADEVTGTAHPSLRYTGGRVSAEWMLPKALWIARHDHARYDAATRIVEVHDWLMHRLTGAWTAALGLTCSGWSYAPECGGWPTDLLGDLGMERLTDGWPHEPLATGTAVGRVRPVAAAALGLPGDVVVGQGTMDTFAAATACNVFQPGRVALSMGSSSAYVALTREPLFDSRVLGPVPAAFGSKVWAVYGGQTSAGSALRWFQRELAPQMGLAELDAQAAEVEIGAEGVRALDTFQGSRTPHRDPHRRGAFWGLSLSHRRATLYRALLEGIAIGGGEVVRVVADMGIPTTDITACGGGSRSSLWMQIHADVLGRTIATLDSPDAAALGAAMCAAVSVGAHPDLSSAARRMARPGAVYTPGEGRTQAYRTLADEYARVGRLLAAREPAGRPPATSFQDVTPHS